MQFLSGLLYLVLICLPCVNAYADIRNFDCEIYFSTGNEQKWDEFSQLLGPLNVRRIDSDLSEIESDHLDVVVHKASQYDGLENVVIVEDSALHVEGSEEFGVNVKWHVHKIDQYIGRRAEWTVLLAYRKGEDVFVYRASIAGVLVPRRGPGDGFSPYFQPDGFTKTLAEMQNRVSPRKQVVMNLMAGKVYAIRPVIREWAGSFQ